MINRNVCCIVSLHRIETLMRGIFDTMHHNAPKHYNQYTIHCDAPTGKVPGIQKCISATLTVFTFPNLTGCMKILPVPGDWVTVTVGGTVVERQCRKLHSSAPFISWRNSLKSGTKGSKI